jgi:hypothetical protein
VTEPGTPGAPPPAEHPEHPERPGSPGRLPGGVNPYVAVVAAWLVPGLGHLLLRRRARAVLFLLLVLTAIAVGCQLLGNLYQVVPGQPLSFLATIGTMGMGLPYFLLRYLLDYQGDVVAAGYEYGTAFLLTAGLMNLLLVLDAWDIALGKKE